MKRENNWSEEDDGRTIADMSGLERSGMFLPGRLRDRKKPEKPENPVNSGSSEFEEPLSRRDRRIYIFAALQAALLIALVFIVGLGLVIWILLAIWS